MARPKTKSALVQGMTELVESIRKIESQLSSLAKQSLNGVRRGPGRPASGRGPGRPPKKGKRGRPAGSGRGPGRPSKTGRGPGRPAGTGRKPGRPAKAGRAKRRGRGRPPGSKNKAK